MNLTDMALSPRNQTQKEFLFTWSSRTEKMNPWRPSHHCDFQRRVSAGEKEHGETSYPDLGEGYVGGLKAHM